MDLPRSRALCPALLFGALLAGTAQAATIGFDGTMGGASMIIQNTSTSAQIVRVHITIGDTAYNFDNISLSTGNGPTLLSPDTSNDGLRSDLTEITFTSFDPGDQQSFPWDIDPDTGNSGCCRVSGVLINNGALPNAVLTVDFSSGHQVVLVLPDTQTLADDPNNGPACPVSSSCAFSHSVAVPEPHTAGLLAGSTLALVGRRRRLRMRSRR